MRDRPSSIDIAQRSRAPELLDLGVAPDEAARSLADLRLVNRWLGGRRSLARYALPALRASSRPRLLDVGCGSGDLPAFLAGGLGQPLLAVGVDIKVHHLREVPASVRAVVADVRALPFPPRSFDVVTASLFLHHFDDGEAAAVLRALYAVTRGTLVINDLRRARLPLVFGRAVFPRVFRSYVSVHDGLVSIRRAFTGPELRRTFAEAGIPEVAVHSVFPYRLVAVAPRVRDDGAGRRA